LNRACKFAWKVRQFCKTGNIFCTADDELIDSPYGSNPIEAVANVISEFNRDVIDTVSEQADTFMGKHEYSSIGAVVGATYPEEAVSLRKIMPRIV